MTHVIIDEVDTMLTQGFGAGGLSTTSVLPQYYLSTDSVLTPYYFSTSSEKISVCVRMYIRMYVNVFICMCTYLYVCLYVFMRMYIRMYVNVFMYVCVRIYMYVYVFICMCAYLYVCVYACMYVCERIYMYVNVFICMCVDIRAILRSVMVNRNSSSSSYEASEGRDRPEGKATGKKGLLFSRSRKSIAVNPESFDSENFKADDVSGYSQISILS